MSKNPADYSTRKGVRSISWEDFHSLCKGLAKEVSLFHPEIILAIGRGGYYPGALLAHILQTEIYPVRLSRRVNDVITYKKPRWIVRPPKKVKGCRVLIVDEICSSGETIQIVKDKTRALGAKETKSAVLYAHTWGVSVPDYIGLVSDELILNPWDREIYKNGEFQFHPEYVDAFAQQGLEADPTYLITAEPVKIEKG